jgi:hypothetical protein
MVPVFEKDFDALRKIVPPLPAPAGFELLPPKAVIEPLKSI